MTTQFFTVAVMQKWSVDQYGGHCRCSYHMPHWC